MSVFGASTLTTEMIASTVYYGADAMNFLSRERRALERACPGLDGALRERPLAELEGTDSPVLDLFRSHGGPALVVPKELGGGGADLLETARVHRALGSRSPSLAVAATMHNYTVATLALWDVYGDWGRETFRRVAAHGELLASAFAEGQTNRSIRTSSMRVTRDGDGYRLSGSKRPCSLSRSLDWLFASVVMDGDDGEERLAVALVAGDSPGITRRPFWGTPVLAASESDEVVLERVFVPADQLYVVQSDARGLDTAEIGGTVWFEVLASASYLGVASALVEGIVAGERGPATERQALAGRLEAAMASLEAVARELASEGPTEDVLARALLLRYAAQDAVRTAASEAAELLGGMAFVGTPDTAYLLAAAQALPYHPPSRLSMAESLSTYLAGGPLRLV